MSQTINYIQRLTNIPSPTGYTTEIMDYVAREVTSYGYQANRTNKGGIMVTVPGTNDQQHRILTAHLDTL